MPFVGWVNKFVFKFLSMTSWLLLSKMLPFLSVEKLAFTLSSDRKVHLCLLFVLTCISAVYLVIDAICLVEDNVKFKCWVFQCLIK